MPRTRDEGSAIERVSQAVMKLQGRRTDCWPPSTCCKNLRDRREASPPVTVPRTARDWHAFGRSTVHDPSDTAVSNRAGRARCRPCRRARAPSRRTAGGRSASDGNLEDRSGADHSGKPRCLHPRCSGGRFRPGQGGSPCLKRHPRTLRAARHRRAAVVAGRNARWSAPHASSSET
jgi:hypothetical protein